MRFEATRLQAARKWRGLTKRRLADATSLNIKSVVNYEMARTVPSPVAAESLARALQVFPTFFERPEIELPSADSSSFRSLAAMTAGQRDCALAGGAIAMEVSSWLETRFEFPAVDIPSIRDAADPGTAAEAIRSAWGLGMQPISNMVHLLESRGVRVFSLSVNGPNVDAFSVWQDGKPFVFLNMKKSPEHGRMDAAHELGHLVLHRHGGPKGRIAESEADRFASAFLMPRADVLAHAPRNPSLDVLVKAKARWGVSLAALTYRLHTVDLLSDWQYRMHFVEMSSKGYRKQEPKSMPRESSQALRKMFGLLREDNISRHRIARELSIRPEDLDAFVFGLALSAIPGGLNGTAATPKNRRPTILRVV
jgi:Zn-dependent peptidase ImmA (M78 family)/transcriptional regulator with XRE-family HTH domain